MLVTHLSSPSYHTLTVSVCSLDLLHISGGGEQQLHNRWFPVTCVLVFSVIWVIMASEELQTGHNRKAGKEMALHKRFSQLGKKHTEKSSSIHPTSDESAVPSTWYRVNFYADKGKSTRAETLVGTSNVQQLLHLTRQFL